jgi:hypothetical protein
MPSFHRTDPMKRRTRLLALLLMPALSAPAAAAQWGLDDARASHRVIAPEPGAALPDGLTAVTVDGRRGALYDGPRRVAQWDLTDGGASLAAAVVSGDARHLFVLEQNGRLSRRRLPDLALKADVRAGRRASLLVQSADGRYLLVANDEPESLLVLRAGDLAPLRLIEGIDRGGRPSGFAWLGVAARRESFLAALADARELWEISYADEPAPVFPGLVHDYRLGEGLALDEPFPVRRIELPVRMLAAVPGPADENLVAVPADASELRVVNLLVGREIRRLPGTASTRAEAIAPWRAAGRAWAAVASPPGLVFFDLLLGERSAQVALPAPARALYADSSGRHLWAVMDGDRPRAGLAVIDGPGAAARWVETGGAAPRALRFSPDGVWAYVTADAPDVQARVVNARTLAPATSAR